MIATVWPFENELPVGLRATFPMPWGNTVREKWFVVKALKRAETAGPGFTIFKLKGFDVPLADPPQREKAYPGLGTPLSWTVLPYAYIGKTGFNWIVPLLGGFTASAVPKIAWTVVGLSIARLIMGFVPVASPDQPRNVQPLEGTAVS